MKIWVHLLASSILAAALYPLFGWEVLFIFVGGVLIDIDHYFLFVYRYRKFGLRDCNKLYMTEGCKSENNPFMGSITLFHTLEFLLVMIVLSAHSKIILIITTGMVVHYLLDIIHRYNISKNFVTDPSMIHWIYKNKIKNTGKDH